MNKIIIALDPSGNHASEGEGSGTTGVAIYRNGIITLDEIKASDYTKTEEYWHAILNLLVYTKPDYVVFEGYKLYNHKGMSAQTQSYSTLMTSQLIGAIRATCYNHFIKTDIQYATDVKSRWADHVLQYKGYLDEKNYFNGKPTNAHKRDALRHLLHFMKYKLSEMEEVKQ